MHKKHIGTIRKIFRRDAGQSENPIEIIWESNETVFPAGFPIVLENTALIFDRFQDKLFARCTFRSITDKVIKAIRIEMICSDTWGNTLGGPVSFQYLDVNTRRDSKFGQTQPIELADKTTRKITVSVSKVLFGDGTAADGGGTVCTMNAPVPLSRHFSSQELAEAYTRETTPNAQFVPEFAEGFWRCACGCLNTGAEETCHHCGCTVAQLTSALDPSVLNANLQQLEAEQRAAEEEARREQQLAQAKKRRKTAVIVLLLTLILGAAGCGVVFYGIPYLHYTDARALLDSGAYDAAHQAFLDLGNFRDSADLANEALYQKAAVEMEEQDYLTAMEIFEGLGSYADSADRALEAKYLKAGAYLDEKDYVFAYEFYEELGSYQDSQDKLLTTLLLWEAEALGSSVNAEAIRFVQTVTLQPEHYGLYYDTILLYLNIQDDLQTWHDQYFPYACAKVNSMLKLLPVTYKDTSSLLELFGWLASDNNSHYDLFREKEDLLREYWSMTFVQALAEDDWFIINFLEGYWTTYSGDYFLTFYEGDDDLMHSEYNLPWVPKPEGYKYYDIKDQIYIYIDEDHNELAKVFRFNLIDYDTIEVFCYKNNRTYTLYR